MADVFISYSSNDRATAQSVAQALEGRGLSVWWDSNIRLGRRYDSSIDEQLDAARCVVVLWSADAASSNWVRDESGEALSKNRLVPAFIAKGVRIPLEFRRVQAADLSDWQPGSDSPEFEKFFAAVSEQVSAGPPTMSKAVKAKVMAAQQAAPAAAPVAAPASPPAAKNRKLWVWVGVAVLAAGAGVQSLRGERSPAPAMREAAPSPAAPAAEPSAAPLPLRGLGQQAANGFDMPLQWRDHILGYQGHLLWDGRSQMATVEWRATDMGNGAAIGAGKQPAAVRDTRPGQKVFSMQVVVPRGDSHTPGRHEHNVNLVFQQQAGGGWLFWQNCADPNTCYP
jgi:TIR domain